MPRVRIIAYGNPLRSDDGVAWRAADLLAEKLHSRNVKILRLHQLTPELADTLREYGCVIFVDAASSDDSADHPGAIQVKSVDIQSREPARFSHVFSPQRVVSLSAQLYGVRPRAFAVTVFGGSFEHGDELSSPVSHALPGLISTIERLVRDAASEA